MGYHAKESTHIHMSIVDGISPRSVNAGYSVAYGFIIYGSLPSMRQNRAPGIGSTLIVCCEIMIYVSYAFERSKSAIEQIKNRYYDGTRAFPPDLPTHRTYHHY